MKFKLFSVVLLLVCFVFLGVLSGVVPVTEWTGSTADLFARFAAGPGPESSGRPTPAAETGQGAVSAFSAASPAKTSPVAPVLPEARTASTKAPYTAPAPTFPTVTRAPETAAKPAATEEPAVTEEPAATEAPAVTEEPAATEAPAVPAETPEPTAVPEAAPEPEVSLWEPAAAVISTTITWNDPIQNDTSYEVDGAALLDGPLDVSLPAEGYQILIIHTHGTEAYTPSGEDQYEASGDYRTLDPDHSIIRVGQALGAALEEYGLHVLVDTGVYDWPDYNSAYARCGAAIQTHLQENPGIGVVIDLHRDALGDDATMYKTVSDQVQPDAAQIMFVVGTDTNLPHPNWRKNLAFAMSLQGLLEDSCPHIMRPTLLCPYRYNQQMTEGSVLLEIGAAGNTLQEAVTAAELFARTVGPALAERVGE